MAQFDKVVEKIKAILKKDSHGLTIQDLANHTNSSRITTALALKLLQGAELLEIRTIGKYKLHYWRKDR